MSGPVDSKKLAWIAPRTHRASGVTMRETVKHLDATRAERLMRAAKEGRAAVRPPAARADASGR